MKTLREITDFPCRKSLFQTSIKCSNSRALRKDVDHSFLMSISFIIEFFLTRVSCYFVSTRDGISSQIFDLFVIRNRNQNFKTIPSQDLLPSFD